MKTFSRRDFLKVAGASAMGALISNPLQNIKSMHAAGSRPNIIIILCDAFSARHLSLYGYPRRTTPFIDNFAEYSTVYHNHYSGSNYTTTGTATMLTGMLPWKHRAINYGGLVARNLKDNNPFTLLGNEYKRFAFSQNPWPERLMGQYSNEIERFLSCYSYSLIKNGPVQNFLRNDFDIASVALDDFSLPAQHGATPGASFGDYLLKSTLLNFAPQSSRYLAGYPEIMDPGYYIPYLNEDVFDSAFDEISELHDEGDPFFAYFHLYSPHFPYRPRNDYRSRFKDGYKPVAKPVHPLSGGLDQNFLNGQHDLYDRQISQVDDEFGLLISRLSDAGVLDNSYVILTSDHGELFERGFVGHGFQYLYESVVKIPLIVHAPGQSSRVDISTPTSNIDILPTLISLAGKSIPGEIDGVVLPGFGGVEEAERSIFSMVAVENSSFGPIKKAVVSLRKGSYKLIAYLGYDLPDELELYNLDEDPDELNNMARNETAITRVLHQQLLEALDAADRDFLKRNS